MTTHSIDPSTVATGGPRLLALPAGRPAIAAED